MVTPVDIQNKEVKFCIAINIRQLLSLVFLFLSLFFFLSCKLFFSCFLLRYFSRVCNSYHCNAQTRKRVFRVANSLDISSLLLLSYFIIRVFFIFKLFQPFYSHSCILFQAKDFCNFSDYGRRKLASGEESWKVVEIIEPNGVKSV